MLHKTHRLSIPATVVSDNPGERCRISVDQYYEEASRILKAELARRDISYQTLADLLGDETYGQLKSKINRGSFSVGFFIKVMRAIGAEQIDLRQVAGPRRR